MFVALRKIGFVLLLRVLAALLAFYTASFVTNTLSVYESGVFFFVSTSILMLTSFSTFGLQNVVLKFYSQKKYEYNLVGSFYRTSFVTSCLVILMSYSFICIEGLLFDWFALVVLLYCSSLLQLSSLYYQAVGRLSRSILFQTILVNLLFVACAKLIDANTLIEVFLSFLAAYVLCAMCAVGLVSFRESLCQEWLMARDLTLGKQFFYINTLSQVLMLGGAVLAKANLSNEEFAMLSVGLRISALLNFLIVAINFVYSPKLVNMHSENKMRALMLLNRISILSLLCSLPVFLFLMFFSFEILRLFGEEYVQASGILLVLVAGQVSVSMLGAGGQYLMLTGHEILLRNITTVSVIFSLTSAYVGSLFYGVIGAASSIAISVVFHNISIICAIYYRERFFILSPRGLFR